MGIDRGDAWEDAGRVERRELWQTVRDARKALGDIVAVLGEGPCADIRCPGCAYEYDEAAGIAREALARWQHVARDGDCREFEGDG